MSSQLTPVFELRWSEKLQLVQDLWDDLAARAEDMPVPPEVLEGLERRKAAHIKNPAAAASWEDVKKRIRARHDR
jgi:putative addiction module component (TIGR02574 family)